MLRITPDTLDKALGLLGELLAARNHRHQHFVVCGGSSLLALGLVSRTTTQDVDILARIDADGLVTPRPLPDWLLTADELLDAARWTRTQDPSEGFLFNLRSLLKQLGHEHLAAQL